MTALFDIVQEPKVLSGLMFLFFAFVIWLGSAKGMAGQNRFGVEPIRAKSDALDAQPGPWSHKGDDAIGSKPINADSKNDESATATKARSALTMQIEATTWVAKYKQSIAQGADEATAVFEAERSSDGHTGRRPKSIPCTTSKF